MSRSALASEELANQLLNEIHTEQEVAELVHREFAENADVDWVPLGRQTNNYSIVENQQEESMAALTELITNSVDAVILKNYEQRYGESGSGDEFDDMYDAADALVDEDKCEISLRAQGEKNGPFSLTVVDNGKGQPRSRFEATFLNVLTPGEIKQEFEFLQGKYGMGSTGSLPFCGDRGYKLVVSASHDDPEKWSWSLIRKNREKTRYEYLIVDDDVPTFEGTVNGREYGSFVKCFNYEAEYKSEINQYFRRHLERYVVESPLPIQLEDERYSGFGDVSTKGLLPRLKQNKEYVEDVDEIEHSFDNSILGTRLVRIYLMKADDVIEEQELSEYSKKNFVGTRHREQAILFTVNGQTHGDQGRTFIKRRCNFNRVAGDTLVFIDFSDVSDADIVDLFKPSRDRLTEKEPAKALREELEELISDNEMLKQEEQRRRNRMAKEESDELEEDILEEILQKNPALKGYLRAGQKQPTVTEEGDNDPDYDGKFYPDRFEIIKSYRARTNYKVFDGPERAYKKEIPVNKTSTQKFELNAENDYLTRDTETGSINASIPQVVKSVRLKDGILSVSLQAPDGAEPGHSMPLQLTAEPAQTGSGKLTQTISLQFTEPVEDSGGGGGDKKQSQGFELPEAYWVEKDEWEQHDMDEQSIVNIDPYDDEIVLYINKHAAPLQNFIVRHNVKEGAKEKVQQIYKLAVIFYSVGQYIEIKNKYSDNPLWEEIDFAEVVETSMQGVAQSLLEQTISDDELDRFTV
jgi:regulator of replication initiation timing